MPIITHEDELELAKSEKSLASHLKKVARLQRTVSDSQKKLADNIAKLNIARQILNRTFRDVLKQMQTLRKDDLAARCDFFANALGEIAGRRSGVIKKALSIEKTKNKMIEGSKLTMLENELNDLQRDFDQARNILLKEIEQFLQTRAELNDLWIKLQDSTTEMS